MLSLRAGGLITSVRGAQGGYLLTRPPQTITILQVIECLELELLTAENYMSESCSDSISLCAANEVWSRLHRAVEETLGAISLEDMLNIPASQNANWSYAI